MNNSCPVCEEKKEKGKHLICRNCYQLYTNQAGLTLAREGKVVPFVLWAREQVEKKLKEVENEVNKVKEKYKNLAKETNQEGYKEIMKTLKGKRIDSRVLMIGLKEKKEKIWKEKGGNKVYWKMKISENRLNFLKNLIYELNEKIKDTENNKKEEEIKN